MTPARTLSILGSTGSIGRSTLDLVARRPNELSVAALASRGSAAAIVEQARAHRPRLVALFDPQAAEDAERRLRGTGIAVRGGVEGVLEAAAMDGADTVVSAIVGAAGIVPTFAAVEAGKRVALANKEALVAAGRIITEQAARSGAAIIPVDSEHSAVFQVLQGQDLGGVRRLVLTASGGPFFGKPRELLDRVTPAMALDHPRWKMGPKVTVDSATMMNKGLEVIEAHWLFGLPPEGIDVLIHPQSAVHSLVEFADGSSLAQMGPADMRIPIAFALSFPRRTPLPLEPLDLAALGRLEFYRPDPSFFPCLGLAYRALRAGGALPAAMNAANEVAVDAFLSERLRFSDIPRVVERVMDAAADGGDSTLAGVLRSDQLARAEAREAIEAMR